MSVVSSYFVFYFFINIEIKEGEISDTTSVVSVLTGIQKLAHLVIIVGNTK